MLHPLRLEFRLVAIAAWMVTLSGIAAVSALVGGGISTATGVLFLAAAMLPPAVYLLVFRGAPPKSVRQVLYEQERVPARVPALQRTGQGRS